MSTDTITDTLGLFIWEVRVPKARNRRFALPIRRSLYDEQQLASAPSQALVLSDRNIFYKSNNALI